MKPNNVRRPGPFGPATRIAILGIIGVLGYSVAARPAVSPTPDLQTVRDRIANVAPPPPLRKPEVGELLQTPDLKPDQRARIERLVSQWRDAKDALQQAMQGFDVEGRSTEVRLRAELQDYSALSRRYDAERNRFWQEGCRVLTQEQRRAIEARQGASR